jgi:hypothetical protein
MKAKSVILCLVLASTGFFPGCSEKRHETSEDHHQQIAKTTSASEVDAASPEFEVDPKFQNQLADLFNSYVELKDAFVLSDYGKIRLEAAETSKALADVDMKLLSGAAHHDWMTLMNPMQLSLQAIASAKDIEMQRKSFSTLSDNLYKSVKSFGLGGQDAYYEYCPMAFNNEGGYWLSNEDKVRNPYFGDKMLTCGEVMEKLR